MIEYLKQINSNIATLIHYRELILTLAIREIKIRYKQTFLGIFWAILQPLSMMIIFTIVFSLFTKVPTRDVPYPIFSYSALLPWTFFATSINFASMSLLANKGLITKIYFPREIFPVSAIIAALVDFVIASFVFLFLMYYYSFSVNIYFLLLPLLVALQVILALGLGLLLAAVNVFYRDVRYIVPLGIQLWMFISPVIYSIDTVPEKYQFFYLLNPMAGIIGSYRSIVLHGELPSIWTLLSAVILSIGLFIVSYNFFKHLEKQFADII